MSAQPGVLFAPHTHAALRRGIDQLADLVRPTLGPTPRCVAVASASPSRAPEVLDDAATILRRVIQIPDPYADMGAMLLRHTVWQTSKAVGDGAATTAVLFQALVRHAGRYCAAGGDPIALRHGLERGLAVACAALQALARPLEGPAALARMASALCHDQEMATLLGEIFDIVGSDGYVQIEESHTKSLERQYVEGVHWYEGYLSPYFITDPGKQEARLENPSILISDLRLTTAEQLTPLLERLTKAHSHSLLVIAQEVSGSALGLLVANHQRGTLRSLAVKAPSFGVHQAHILEDLAILTGGRVVTQAGGELAQMVAVAAHGSARVAWATAKAFGIQGGQGDPLLLRQRIAQIKAEQAHASDPDAQAQSQERLGKLMGGVAILQVGAITAAQREARKTTAQRAITALKLVLDGGVAPGGGTAYLLCRSALQMLPATSDEKVALQVLAAALEEPLRVIAHNAGYEPTTIVARVHASPPGWGFDARTGQITEMQTVGILDPVPVLQAALQAAVSGAVMALTTDVLIHQRKPMMVATP